MELDGRERDLAEPVPETVAELDRARVVAVELGDGFGEALWPVV
jgi:hypothetical protein